MLRSELLKVQHHRPFIIERMEGKPWQKIMNTGLDILKMCGFNCQPGSGTLLGLIREKDGYIHHDTDIDIDVFIDKNDKGLADKIKKMSMLFTHVGFKLIRTQYYGEIPSQIAFIDTEYNLIFDLCFFYNSWGTDWVNVYEHGIFLRPPYSVNKTTLFKLNGYTYTIPKDVNRYLTGRYGDWRTPTRDKKSGEKDAANYLILL